jgi:hypothetical protein
VTSWRVTWRAALYVLCRNSAPQWFQVDFAFDESGTFLEQLSSITLADGPALVGIRAQYRALDEDDTWINAAGWGPRPLDPRT